MPVQDPPAVVAATPSAAGDECLDSAPVPEAAHLHGLERAGRSIRARLDIGGAEHLISYRFSGVEPEERYEPFVAATAPIAMRRAVPLRLPASISPRLRRGLSTAQRILHAWHPELRPIEVQTSGESPPPTAARGVACFFSGGVDSFYSVLRHRDRLNALIHVHGFDVPLSDRARRAEVAPSVRRAAKALDLPLIEVETDLRLISDRYAIWGSQYHGAALASVALLASTRFRKVLVPATHSEENLLPWGSHPLLDPLWSTETVEVVHDGAIPRPEKLRALADSEVAMRNLRVCFLHSRHGVATLNCGRCEKCLRTMAGLRAVGALDRCDTFPGGLSLRRLARAPVLTEHTVVRIAENLAAAEAAGDRELARALRRMARRGRRAAWLIRRRDALARRRAVARRHARRRIRRLRRTRRRMRRRARACA